MTLLVIITASERERIAEGLRAAVGLGLRGDPVEALLVGGQVPEDPRIARALGTLERLGRPARAATMAEAQAAARTARAVEVWTDPGSPRRLDLGAAGSIDPRAIDSQRLVEQIFEADAAVLW
jgi:hypothetical protein